MFKKAGLLILGLSSLLMLIRNLLEVDIPVILILLSMVAGIFVLGIAAYKQGAFSKFSSSLLVYFVIAVLFIVVQLYLL